MPTYGYYVEPSKKEVKSYERRLYVERMANKRLGDYNAALERGALKTADKHLRTAQYWLDELNRIDGNA